MRRRFIRQNSNTPFAIGRFDSTRGFTIIELLLVIVVIAILAAITIVAYNGIQARAKVAKKQAEISSFARAVDVYNAGHADSVHLTDEMTQAQVDAAMTALGLDGMKDSVVVDSGLALNSDSCHQAPMTKDSYCMAAVGNEKRVTYWNDIEKKWILRESFDGKPFVDSDAGTGPYPETLVY